MKNTILFLLVSLLCSSMAHAYSIECKLIRGQQGYRTLTIIGSKTAITLSIEGLNFGQFFRKEELENSDDELAFSYWEVDEMYPFVLKFPTVGTRAYVPFIATLDMVDMKTLMDKKLKYNCLKQ